MQAGTSLLGGGLQLGSSGHRPATRQPLRLRRAAGRRPPPVSCTQALQPGPVTAPVERALEAALNYVLPSASLGEVENMAVGMALGGTLLLIVARLFPCLAPAAAAPAEKRAQPGSQDGQQTEQGAQPVQLLQLLRQEWDDQSEVRAQEREAYQKLEARVRALEDPAAGANSPRNEQETA